MGSSEGEWMGVGRGRNCLSEHGKFNVSKAFAMSLQYQIVVFDYCDGTRV